MATWSSGAAGFAETPLSWQPDGMVRIVLATFSHAESAAEITGILISEKLAACANIIPTIRSIYEWDGKIQDESEALALIKTSTDTLEALERRLRELHPYEVPEIIAIEPDRVHEPYANWVREACRLP